MDQRELDWLAGLLEGEGCFTSEGYGSKGKTRVVVVVQMADRDVIERVATMLGVACSGPYHPKSPFRAQGYYRAKLTGKRARALMEDLAPLMGERRRERIDGLLAQPTARLAA